MPYPAHRTGHHLARVIGQPRDQFAAVCSCGWVDVVVTLELADQAARDHIRAQAEAGRPPGGDPLDPHEARTAGEGDSTPGTYLRPVSGEEP